MTITRQTTVTMLYVDLGPDVPPSDPDTLFDKVFTTLSDLTGHQYTTMAILDLDDNDDSYDVPKGVWYDHKSDHFLTRVICW
jgi:hypothetical protein